MTDKAAIIDVEWRAVPPRRGARNLLWWAGALAGWYLGGVNGQGYWVAVCTGFTGGILGGFAAAAFVTPIVDRLWRRHARG